MNIKRIFVVLIILSSLACNFVTRAFESPTPTSAPIPETPTPVILEPAYIPPACQGQALATVSPAIALAVPTPILQANPVVSPDLQIKVFNELAGIVDEVYVYPDFNGNDWNEIKARVRARINSGLDTPAFYAEIQAMIVELDDEHSYIESPLEVAESEADLAGASEYVGIGVYALPLIEKNVVSLIFVFPNSPAERSGLKAHDSILAVDGIPVIQNGEDLTYIVRGPQCSAVVLTVQSPAEAPRDIMLVREKIQSPLLIQASLLPTSDGSRVGYIFIPTFYDETIPGQVADALGNFGELDGLILDNRLNGGGSSAVVEPILSYFSSGTLGQFVSRTDSRSLTIEPQPIHNSQSVPLVILVSEDTVSFGEIFSGVLRDSGRAQIVGQSTLGNVEILNGYELSDGSSLWIAAETFVPSNSRENWELTGIVPDVEAHADWDTFTLETDPAIPAALKLLGH